VRTVFGSPMKNGPAGPLSEAAALARCGVCSAQ